MEKTAVQAVIGAVADLATFLHASADDIVPVANATTAVNAVVQSVPLQKGDVVLVTTATYPAVRVMSDTCDLIELFVMHLLELFEVFEILA